MPIGTTVKVGFDGKAVSKGLAGITRGFKKLGGVLGRIGRQTAIGGARQVGAGATNLILGGLTAVPNRVKELGMLSQSMQHLSRDTKTAKADLMALRHGFQILTGDGELATDVIREFATRLGEARLEADSTPRKALQKLGVFQPMLKNRDLVQQIEVIAHMVGRYRDEIEKGTKSNQDLTFIMDDLLGDIGPRSITFLENFAENMENGRKATGAFGDRLERSRGHLEKMTEARIKMDQAFSGFALNAAPLFADIVSGINEALDAAEKHGFFRKLEGTVQYFRAVGAGDFFKSALEGVGDFLRNVIADGIKQGISGSALGGGLLNMLAPKTASKDNTGANIEANTAAMAASLRRLTDRPMGARYA